MISYELLPHEYSYALYLSYAYDLHPYDSMILNMVSERYPRDEDDCASAYDSESCEEDESAVVEILSNFPQDPESSTSQGSILFGSFASPIIPVSIPSIASDFDGFSIKIGEITCFLGYSCCSDVDYTITASEEDEKPKNLETEFVSYEVSMTLLNQSCVKAFSSPIKIKRQHDGNVRFSQDQDQDSKKGEPFSDLLLCSSESIIFVSHHHALGITVFDPGGFILVIYRSNIMLAVMSLFDSISLFPFDPGGIFLCHLCFPNSYHEFSYYEFEGGYYNIEVSSATYDSSFGYATLFKID
ncbi:unnamed protein product [Trifolium pratense]|uniref:Uncharacterized protein n=1 Tax=Trifolium pratense TaxID=57577 RepID=A0ACB0JEK6_TRIPR|nr:unnamed protein product [Trifolium pratense]